MSERMSIEQRLRHCAGMDSYLCREAADHIHQLEQEVERLQEFKADCKSDAEAMAEMRAEQAEARLNRLVERLKTEPCYQRGGEVGQWISRHQILEAIAEAKQQ